MKNFLEDMPMNLKLGGKLTVRTVDDILSNMSYYCGSDDNKDFLRVYNHLSNILLLEFTNDSIKLYNDYKKECENLNKANRLKLLKMQEKRARPF